MYLVSRHRGGSAFCGVAGLQLPAAAAHTHTHTHTHLPFASAGGKRYCARALRSRGGPMRVRPLLGCVQQRQLLLGPCGGLRRLPTNSASDKSTTGSIPYMRRVLPVGHTRALGMQPGTRPAHARRGGDRADGMQPFKVLCQPRGMARAAAVESALQVVRRPCRTIT